MPTMRTLLQRNDEQGQVFVFLAVMLVVLLGCAALVVDVGRAYLAKRHLQSSADAAATAGALELPDPIAAQTYALNYSGQDGAKNDNNKLPGVSTTVQTKCLSFAPCSPVNTVVVEQTTVVPTIFAKVLGINEFTIKAKATACSPCSSKPLDIMLILDRTGSMCQFSDGSSDPACTDLTNAKNGLLEFVQYMDPAIHKIGFAVFPPRTSGGSACSTPASGNYNSTSAVYTVVPLSTNYKVGQSLNESSQLVTTIRCQRGGGSTAYAHALERAQTELNSSRGRPGVQNVIVFFSDGAANTGPTYLPTSSPYRRQPCQQGVNSASVIKGAGTLIYSIGYDLDALGGGANICQNGVTGANESPAITAYDAIRQIATNADTFFNRPNPGDLTRVYTQIASEIGGTRLIPDDSL
jgi:Putative Flp pilus-assembly TadE/G-like/von Willebrand factor type A domain